MPRILLSPVVFFLLYKKFLLLAFFRFLIFFLFVFLNNELKQKYSVDFDTLVLDCEGAFYYILQDMPEIIEDIKLIIMENDYKYIKHKNYIDDILIKSGFKVVYSKSGGWGSCTNNFFEVWKK